MILARFHGVAAVQGKHTVERVADRGAALRVKLGVPGRDVDDPAVEESETQLFSGIINGARRLMTDSLKGWRTGIPTPGGRPDED